MFEVIIISSSTPIPKYKSSLKIYASVNSRYSNIKISWISLVIPYMNLYKFFALYLLYVYKVLSYILKKVRKKGTRNIILVLSDVAPYLVSISTLLIATKLMRIPTAYIFTLWQPYQSKTRFLNPLIYFAIKISHAIVTIGKRSYKYVLRLMSLLGVEKHVSIVHLYTCININNDAQLAEECCSTCKVIQDINTYKARGKRVFVWIGRLIPVKGIQWLIETFEHVIKINPNNILIIIGDGPLRHIVEAFAQRYPNNVWYLGSLWNKCKYCIIEHADVGLYTSITTSDIYEEYGIVPIEYLMHGKPVIVSSETGSAPDVAIDGFNGFIVKARDTKGLAKAILHYVQNIEDLHIHGKRSYKIWQRKFSIRAVTYQLCKLLVTTYRLAQDKYG